MKKYELLYIVPGQYTDTEVEGIRKNVLGLIEKINAQVTRHDNLGKIKLAYPINKVRHGTYILIHFELELHDFSVLDSELRMSHEVLRHQIIVAPKGAADRKYEISSYVAPLSEEAPRRESSGSTRTPSRAPAHTPTRTPAPTPAPAAPATPLAPPPPVVKEESNLSVEELDKKLDELLEDDMTKSL